MVKDILIIIVLLVVFTLVVGSIVRGIKTEIEYRRWWRRVKDDTRTN